ncbi:MAG: hypothetical protein II146_00690, partial [Treponema sp.]|nr:hypothetical protein [Treponema sp.]
MRRNIAFVFLLLALAFVATGFSSCMNKAVAQGSKDTASKNEDVQVQQKNEVAEVPVPQVNPEVEKLGRVLSSMSNRAKQAIPNGSPDE